MLTYVRNLLLATAAIASFSSFDIIGHYRVYRMTTNTDNSCQVYFTPVPVDIEYDTRDPSITDYQATSSITFGPGFQTADGDAFVAEIVPGTFGVPQATNLTGSADANINWIQSTTFDENGNIIGDGKQFFDDNGRATQSQNKVFYRAGANTTYTHVLADQKIRDAYGKDAASTLSAPIDYADFSYRPNFLLHNTSGAVYNHQNFDLGSAGDKTNSPDVLWDVTAATPVQGTLAWYYSRYNNWEPYTPESSFPYTRQAWYQDGTGAVKKSAGTGEAFKMGSSHENSSYITPVANELDFYLQLRNRFFATTDLGVLPTSLQSQAMQTVSKDANGKEVITIQDRGGKPLMTARQGTDLTVNNTVSVGGPSAPDMNIYYFKLLAAGTVGISGGSYMLYDMSAEQTVGFSSGNTLQAGYYKLVNTGTTALTLTYSNGYADVSYSFYNQKGQLVAMIAPEGVKKLYTGASNYTSRTTIPFISLYSYDPQGRLVGSQDPDRGAQQFIYRQDGKMRFSQNAAQAVNGSFSYTNYDRFGRIVQSGQYLPGTGGISFGITSLAGILESTDLWGGLSNGTMTDVSITRYDAPDNSHGVSGYTQDAFNLAGAVSLTQRYSSIVNNSPASTYLVSADWYNYDEEGKTVWMIKYINGLGYKTTDYAYDVLGHVVRKVFQSNTTAETFVHYYDYDPVNKQLWHVYTGTVYNPSDPMGVNTRRLQAAYWYDLHGGVRRVELGGTLQGIDYTYTLQGALKAINNSNKAQDPGGDGTNGFGADAFGEVLDYYTGDYANSRANISTFNGVNNTPSTDSYSGNIKAMTWYSEKPASTGLTDAPTTYLYQYDPKYQFMESTWGTGINFGSRPASFTATTLNKESVKDPSTGASAYDGNGNILYLQRTDQNGNSSDQFKYNYANNNNQLTSVVNTATSQPYASYTYDANGQVTGEVTGDATQKYMVYDASGKVTAVYRESTHATLVAGFVYDEKGHRIEKLGYNTSGQLIQVTYYVGDVIYTQPVTNAGTVYGATTAVEYEISGNAGRLGVYYPQGAVYAYELTDHLGNVRAVIATTASPYEVRVYTDYYPFGMVISKGGMSYRYDYQGKSAEKDPETGLNNFDLRMYDSRIARWLQYDPKGQFYSPYLGMGNDPVKNTDPDGGSTQTTIVDINNRVLDVINDGKTDVIRLNFIDYNSWKGYIDDNGGSIFDKWVDLGQKIYDTKIGWFDFMNTDDKTGAFTTPQYGVKVDQYQNGNAVVAATHLKFIQLMRDVRGDGPEIPLLHDYAYLDVLRKYSANGAPLDIKASLGLDMYAGFVYETGIVTSLRIMGNIAFGENMQEAKPWYLTSSYFYNKVMPEVGAYNQSHNGGNGYNAGFPFYGEHTLSGSAIYYGYFGTKP